MSRKAVQRDVAQRIERIRKEMKKKDVQGYVVKNPVNVRYLSGYTADSASLFIGLRKNYLLTDFRFTEQAGIDTAGFDVQLAKGDHIARLARKHRCSKLFYEPGEFSHPGFLGFRKQMKGIKLTPEPGLVGQMRIIKSANEIQQIRECVSVAQAAYTATRRAIRPGVSEQELAARLEYEMRRRGADGTAFPSIVAAGARGSLCHAVPTEKLVKGGSPVLFDWGAYKGQYNCDLTRVVVPSKIPKRLRQVYDIVLEAQKRALAAVAPGVEAGAIDAAARDYITEKGYGDRFGHGTGHGVGMLIHEAPSIVRGSNTKLEPGMVFTVEPGIYVPGWGGVRIEDMVLITEGGFEILTSVPKDIEKAVSTKI